MKAEHLGVLILRWLRSEEPINCGTDCDLDTLPPDLKEQSLAREGLTCAAILRAGRLRVQDPRHSAAPLTRGLNPNFRPKAVVN